MLQVYTFLFHSDTIPAMLTIRCGEWDVKHESEPLLHQERVVEVITIHPRFNPVSVVYDIAVLSLVEDFILAPHIDTICLPDENARTGDFLTDKCVATGWGAENFSKCGITYSYH